MTTRPLGAPPVIPDDPGAWSGVLDVLQRRGKLPGRRRAEPPNGLMLSPPPRTSLTLAGTDRDATVAGVGPVRVVAAAREGALALALKDGVLRGVNKMVERTWDAATLAVMSEAHPETDPAAGLPEPAWIDDLAGGDLPPGAAVESGGGYAAVPVVEPPRYRGLAIVRVADRAVMRYIRFARCGVWTPDASRLIIGGEWGLMMLQHRAPEEPAADDADPPPAAA
ncbi:MAG: hypothetical protein KDC33_11015 [Thermoleophilia bacterium]|nr:hypothetical protein [Thermoleophilia bacterium]